jgi:V8-like Glu-specific endopeptidase
MKTHQKKNLVMKLAALTSGAVVASALAVPTAQADAVTGGAIAAQESTGAIDYANAIPMPLPESPVAPVYDSSDIPPGSLGAPGSVKGAVGSGKKSPVFLPAENGAITSDGNISPQEFGTSNHPFTTKRVDTIGAGAENTASLRYPFRATGKLYFNIGTSTYVCSASLLKRGIIVTAAHCVAEFGKNKFYTNWKYHPARYDGVSPYGVWSTNARWVMTSYFNGTDTCSTPGIVCKNDIAVLRVAPQAGAYPGNATGWYGYGWNGYGFTPANLALFNQLGYPVALDSGLRMQRTDSQAFVSAANAGNSVWGGLQTGGSSGGPELVNLGISPVLSGGIQFGAEAAENTVVGVTSWGYTNQAIKQQGASPFLDTNIVPLVNAACVNQAALACKP